jgi:hypothetical protein
MEMQIKITLYLDDSNEIEAAKLRLFEYQKTEYYTADVRINEYSQNVTIVLSEGKHNLLLNRVMSELTELGVRNKICIEVNADVSTGHYTYVKIDKRDFLTAINEQLENDNTSKKG